MSKRNMGIVLIVVGGVLLAVGIVMVASKGATDESVVDVASMAQNDVRDVASSTPLQTTSENAISVHESSDDEIADASYGSSDESMTSKEKGDAFEDFVVNLLADWRLKLLDRTQDAKSSAGVVAESSKNPDLHVQQKRGNSDIDYYLECKYRSNWKDGVVQFEDWQIERYRKFQRDQRRKVIFALGVGGSPSAPATFMLVPLDSVRKNTIRQIDTQFVVEASPSALCDYMQHYFSAVFDKAKERKKQ